MSLENYAVSWAWKNPPPAEMRRAHDVAEAWEIVRNLLKRAPKTGRPSKKVGGLPE
jgi:hypothetical protein